MIVEHRKYMRVDDRLVISWRPTDSTQLVVDDVRDVMLMSVNREINSMIAGVGETLPDVAQVLMHLNHKLDLLNDRSAHNLYGPALTRLNVSRSGIAFEWRGEFEKGSTVRLSITLPPENEKLHIAAEVLACEPMGGGRHRVRCRFAPAQEDRIEEIGRYVDHVHEMRDERNRLQAPAAGELVAFGRSANDTRDDAPVALVDYR